jgi:predicted peptidase
MLKRIALLACSLVVAAAAYAQPQPGQPPRFVQSDDPRVQNRTYTFTDTNEEMPYSLFVSSQVAADTPAPLVVVLHGLGIGPGFMLRRSILDHAEEGGYIAVSPMGYNVGGWYGPLTTGRNGEPLNPPNLAELSENDVMNVLAMVREEFNVDPNRIYLMGHSMGGAGTWFLGVKHADIWAALGGIAPAAFALDPASFAGIKDTIPVILVHGDMDEAVPVDIARRWATWMADNGMEHEYHELPGVTHGPVIEEGMDEIFAFFAAHAKGD